MNITKISKTDLKKFHDILDRVYEFNPDDREKVLRFIRFLSKRDYLRRRDYDRNSIGIGIRNAIVDDELCLIQTNELQAIAYGENSIVDLIYALLFKYRGVFPVNLLSDFFRRFCDFLDIIESEKMVGFDIYLYDEVLLFNSYIILKTFEVLGDIEKQKGQRFSLDLDKDDELFIKKFPIIDGVDKMVRFLDFKKSIDMLTELRKFSNNKFDINKLILAYMNDIDGYSKSNMLTIIENMDKFVRDDYELLLYRGNCDVSNIAIALNEAFINQSDKMVYYSKALLDGDRFQYINSKLEGIEENPFIRNEIFSAISSIDVLLFNYLNNEASMVGKDSFIELMDIVFDSDSYYELFYKLESLNKICKYLAEGHSTLAATELKTFKTDIYKEKIGDYVVKYPTNTMNKIEKPKTIVDRMKTLYRNVYPQLHLVDFDKIHLESNSYNNFAQKLLCDLEKAEEKLVNDKSDTKVEVPKHKNRRFSW